MILDMAALALIAKNYIYVEEVNEVLGIKDGEEMPE